MKVEQLMSEATGCREGASVRDCARIMKERNIGFLPVCDAQGAPIGAITDRDLTVRVLAEGKGPDEKISAVMTRDVVGCRIGEDLSQAERLMRDRRMSRVMVCDAGGKLRGVISLADIADATDEHAAGATVREVKSDQPPAH